MICGQPVGWSPHLVQEHTWFALGVVTSEMVAPAGVEPASLSAFPARSALPVELQGRGGAAGI